MTTTTKELNGINYELYDDGSKKWAVVTSARPRRNSAEEVEIPHDVDGYVVIAVANRAFHSFFENQWIKTITFNSPIVQIHRDAFSVLSNLEEVKFMAVQGTPIFDTECFDGCANLGCIFWKNHKRFGKIDLFRERAGKLSEWRNGILRSVLMKSNKRAFIGCYKMPTALEKH